MANNSVLASIIIRNATAANWTTRNPVLNRGEYGLENDTRLMKVGDGVRDWQHLPYLNKLNETYFNQEEDGSLTFSDSFLNTIAALEAAAGEAIDHLTITDPPVNPTDVPNKQYVDDQIAQAGMLKRAIVESLPDPAQADENTMYMVPAASGNYYEEYMLINGAWDMVGETGDGGSGGFTLEIATSAKLGGVKSAPLDNEGHVLTDDDYIVVDKNTGFMTLNQVSTSLLYVPTGDTLTLYGGSA